MKILVLEDDFYRADEFARLLGPFALSRSAPDAITRLDESRWDVLFLDHDLGRSDGTGYDVAKWLEERPAMQPPVIVLHSYNPVGRARMKQALPMAVTWKFGEPLPFASAPLSDAMEEG